MCFLLGMYQIFRYYVDALETKYFKRGLIGRSEKGVPVHT